jgi:hypothetical protein
MHRFKEIGRRRGALANLILGIVLALFLTVVAGCSSGSGGGGGGDDDDNGDAGVIGLTFRAPDGSGFVGDHIDGISAHSIIDLDLTLEPGVPITGEVSDGLGVPLAGVDILFKRLPLNPPIVSVTTDGLGAFDTLLTLGTWYAELKGDDTFGRETLGPFTVDGPDDFPFEFQAKVSIAGSVLEAGAGSPLAELKFKGEMTGAEVEVTCDALGAYAVELVPDDYEVEVKPTGPSEDVYLQQTFPLTVAAGTPQGGADFPLTEGVLVTGLLIDGVTGQPSDDVIRVEIKLPPDSSFAPPDGADSNPGDGTYSIGPVPLGEVLFEFYPPIPTELPAQGHYTMIDVPGQQLVDVDLEGGVVLDGSACGDGVCKVGGVRVEVFRECTKVPGEFECKFEFEFEIEVEIEVDVPSIVTVEGENFAIPVFPGNYQVRMFPDPASFQLPEISDIAVPSPSPLDVLLDRGAIVTGLVTDGVGAAGGGCIKVPGEFECEFEIEIEPEPGDHLVAGGDTDIDGVYSFLGPIGTHTLLLKEKAGPLLDVALKPVPDVNIALPGPNIVNIVVEAETEGLIRIGGKVFEPDGVTPAAGVDIFARFEDNISRANLIGRAHSDLDGSYVLVIKEP